MIKRFLLLSLILTNLFLHAQRTNSSPYSFFGFGEEFNSQTVEQASMGGFGVAFSSNRHLNFINPAAVANLRITTFSFGLLNNDLSISDNISKQSSASTNLSYVALGFPIGKQAGFMVGFKPLSTIGYSLVNLRRDNEDVLVESNLFSGSGGVNTLFLNFGMQLFNGFSFGVEGGFSFGQSDNSILNQRLGVTLATKAIEETTLRGAALKLGVLYKKKFKDNLTLNTGLSFATNSNLNVKGNESVYSLLVGNVGQESPRDILYSGSISGKFSIPTKTVVGVGLGKVDKWFAGVEYESQGAVESQNFLTNTINSFKFESSNRFSVGGFYIPKMNSISSYWERVTYRGGLRIENTGLLLDGTNTGNNFTSIKDFGITLGLGLPLGNRLSNLNIGFEYGQKGTLDSNLIKENYFNIRLSLSLNDVNWFGKRRID